MAAALPAETVTAVMTKLVFAPLLAAGLALVWNITLAGWIASRRDAPAWFSRLTALAGLLVAPAAVLGVAASTDVGARTITGVAWLWPATCLLVALQATLATGVRLVPFRTGAPLVLYNLVVAAIAVGDDLLARSGQAPWFLQGAVAARDSVFGLLWGPAALASPFTLLVPLLAPAYAARWRSSALIRSVLVVSAAATAFVLLAAWPRGVDAVASYSAGPASDVPRDTIAIGVRLLPTVRGVPSARTVRLGRRLMERVDPQVVLVVMAPSAARTASLDSLIRVLDSYRETGTRLVVALAFDFDDARAARDDPAGSRQRRVDALERLVARLEPEAVILALPPLIPGVRPAPAVPATWWDTTLRASASAVHRVRPQTQTVWMATRFDAADSARYAWTMAPNSPIDAAGFAVTPGFDGQLTLEERLVTADRWANSRNTRARPHWVLTAALPRAHGDAAQARAIERVLGWSAERSWIRGVIVGDPTDAANTTGLLAADLRERTAVAMLRRWTRAADSR
jgi:hypothetical protein